MKNSLFALCACAVCVSVALAAPASKTQIKVSATKATAKAVAVKTPAQVVAKVPAKTAPIQIAQTDSATKPEGMPGFFPDVPRDHWAFAAVQRLASAGIVEGYPAAPAQAATAPAMAAKVAAAKDVKVAVKTEAAPQRVAAPPEKKQSE